MSVPPGHGGHDRTAAPDLLHEFVFDLASAFDELLGLISPDHERIRVFHESGRLPPRLLLDVGRVWKNDEPQTVGESLFALGFEKYVYDTAVDG